MTDEELDDHLLKSVSDALGVDTAIFLNGPSTDQTSLADYHNAIVLMRVIRAFRALPNDGARMDVLRMIEERASSD
ncbi:hypothetical protein [Methylobacterium sp. SI9]|uniref:hypothetical protein n=1 Tax=Methylobacterium guangdongense TaxID=3138811 RepID=UPI00313DBFAA